MCIFSKHQWWAPLSLQVWQAATQAGAAQAPALSGELSTKRIDLILDYQAPASTCNYRYKQVICHNLSAISLAKWWLKQSVGTLSDGSLLRLRRVFSWCTSPPLRIHRTTQARQKLIISAEAGHGRPPPRPPCWSYYSSYDLSLSQHSLQAVDSVAQLWGRELNSSNILGMVSYDCFSRQ